VKMRLAFVTAWIVLVLTAGCVAPPGPTHALVKTDLSHHAFGFDCPVGQRDNGAGMCARRVAITRAASQNPGICATSSHGLSG
jgi:hypothetical protein